MKKLLFAVLCMAFATICSAQTISLDSLVQRKIDSTFKAKSDTLISTPNLTFTKVGKVVTADVSPAIAGAATAATKATSDVATLTTTVNNQVKTINDLTARLTAAETTINNQAAAISALQKIIANLKTALQ